MIHIRAAEGGGRSQASGVGEAGCSRRPPDDTGTAPAGTGAAPADLASDVFSDDFLIRRPLLSALDPADGVARCC